MRTRPPQIVCVSNGPLPYHTPILNALAAKTSLHVVYMSRGHPLNAFDDLWGEDPSYPHTFHWSTALGIKGLDFRTQLSAGIAFTLSKLKPDAVLVSSWGPLVWEPLMWARSAGRGSVMWAESTAISGLLRGMFSTAARRLAVRMTDAFVTNGSWAASYLRDLGVPQNRMVVSRLPSPLRPSSGCGAARPTTGLRLLYVGRLIPLKRPLDAIAALASLNDDISLAMVGSGPLAGAVKRAAAPFGDRVRLLGRLEGGALSEAYRQADVLVVPSEREVWGLVVNEGLAHGLYVIASDQIGSAVDLINNASGCIVPAGNVTALANAIRVADATVDRSNGARDERAHSVSSVTPESFAADILRATSLAVGRRWNHD